MKIVEGYPAPKGRTIDIGCGHNPIQGVTHAIDGFVEDVERGGALKTPDGAEFSVQNIEERTTFEDKYFDFSYCRMVLEHTHDPAAAMNEIMRISKAGFIEVPTWLWEQLHGREYHKQLWWMDGDELVCMPKTEENYMPNSFNGDNLWAAGDTYQKMFAKHLELFTIRLVWTDEIKYRIQEPFELYKQKKPKKTVQ